MKNQQKNHKIESEKTAFISAEKHINKSNANFEKYIEKGNDDKTNANIAEKYQIYLTDTECNFINVARKLLKDEKCLNIKLAE